MQNKANFPVSQMNASYFKTKNYEPRTMNYEPIKQTQFVVSLSNHQTQLLWRTKPKNTSGFVDSLGEAASVFQAKLFSRKEVFYFLYLLFLRPCPKSVQRNFQKIEKFLIYFKPIIRNNPLI